MEAWHFVGKTLRDGSPIPSDSETLRHGGDLALCSSGLHASKRIIDALQYAPGSTICRVECGGEIIEGDDKLVCNERVILWRIDGDELLRAFARRCALDVVDLWDAPDVVRQYLETGDETLRDAARAAARAAAAAIDAAWDAARVVEYATSAASAAARAATRQKQNTLLEQMVREARQ